MTQIERMLFTFKKIRKPLFIPSKWDKKQSIILSKAIQDSHGLVRGFSIQKWSQHFMKLRTLDKIKRSRISNVLSWYICNIKGDYIPEAFSASAFRMKFIRIETAMKRKRSIRTSILDANFDPVLDNAVLLAERLRIYYWPKGSCNDVLETVDASLKEFYGFKKRFKKLQKNLKNSEVGFSKHECSQLQRFCDYLQGVIPSPDHFIEQWMLDVNKQIQNWDEWEGELYRMRFQIRSKRFTRMGFSWALDFCSSGDRWTLFLEELLES